MDAAARPSALVVEDEPALLRLLTSLLERMGIEVCACDNGEEAWALLEQRPRDLLITDWVIPGLSGLDLIRRIRLSESHPGLYIIIVTGRIHSADRVEGLEAGADDFVTKPFDSDELRVRVRAGQRIVSLQKRLLAQNRHLRSSNVEMSRELAAAAALQRALIPALAPRIHGFDCAWAFHPHSQGSGDMFGVHTLDEHRVGLFLVDVSGHGMAAAMLASTVSRLLTPVPGQDTLVKRRLAAPPYYEVVPPDQVLCGLRDWFRNDESGGLYFTMIYAVLNGSSGDLEWVSAGHYPPILARVDGWHTHGEQIAQTPVGLPIPTHGDPTPNRATLAPGERVFFYSDGVVDLRGPEGLWLPGNPFGEALALTSQPSIADTVRSTIDLLRHRVGVGSFEDDVTVVGLERQRAA